MIRLPLLLVALAFAAYGGEELYHATQNRTQTTVSCGELLQARPQALWIRATGCEIDYMGATWRESRGQIRELFFPVHPAGPQPSGPVALVAATTDPEALAVAQGIVGDQRKADQEAFTVMGLRIVTILRASREIEGYARYGAVDRALARQALAGLGGPLASDFLVIDLHARPRLAFPAIVTGTGVLAFVGFVAAGRRRRAVHVMPAPAAAAAAPADVAAEPAVEWHAEEAPSHSDVPEPVPVEVGFERPVPEPAMENPPPAPEPPQPPRPQALPAPAIDSQLLRLPAMMLLNLPPEARTDAIEHAPPLGSRGEVVERIARALPGIHFDDQGRATWHGREWSLAISLGSHEPVWTVTVEARGSAAAELTRHLATRTGWRVYVPKRGEFVLDERLVER